MENLKSILALAIILIIVTVVGYWAFVTLEPGSLSAERQKEAELVKQNRQLQDQVSSLKDQLSSLDSSNNASDNNASAGATQTTAAVSGNPTVSSSTSSAPVKSAITSYKNQTLINQLEQLVTAGITMKLKSQGTRVGTIQTFLNLYNKTSLKVDNDYGTSTQTAIKNFQKAQGLTADGNAGPATFQKMIDWLKKQG